MAEYFFVNAKYENMKSERGSREVKGSIWRNTREDWRNTLACSSSMSYRVIFGPKENFFRVDNTGYKWLFLKNFFLQWREWNPISKFEHALIHIHAIYNFNKI